MAAILYLTPLAAERQHQTMEFPYKLGALAGATNEVTSYGDVASLAERTSACVKRQKICPTSPSLRW